MVNFGWSPMTYCGALVMPFTASVESGQSSPACRIGGGWTAAVGVGVGVALDSTGARTGVLFSGCGVCVVPVPAVLAESEPPKRAKAIPAIRAMARATIPSASPRRRQ